MTYLDPGSRANYMHDLQQFGAKIQIAFVDPISFDQYFFDELRDARVEVIAIYTQPHFSSVATNANQFAHIFSLNNTAQIPALAQQLLELNVKHIFYGSSTSIHVTDQIANLIIPHHANSLDTTHYRTHLPKLGPLAKDLPGKQYSILTFSHNRVHTVSGIKLHNAIYSSYADIVPLDSKEALICKDFVTHLLNTIGLNNGFAHTKLIYNSQGCHLLEIKPHLTQESMITNRLIKDCGLNSQTDLLIAKCTNHYVSMAQQKKYGRKVFLRSHQDRRINALNIGLLYTLPSYKTARMVKKPGSLVEAHLEENTIAHVVLAHADKAQIEKDYQKLMHWQQGFELF